MSNNVTSPNGLTNTEAKARLQKYGPNVLSPPSKISFWRIAKTEIMEPMILLLIFVGVVYSLWGKPEDAITIFCIILALVFVEVWNEFRAKKAIDALSKMAALKAKVLRGGEPTEVLTDQIVPGDLLLLGPGTKISADAKVTTSLGLQIDESVITGESVAVFKEIEQRILAGTLVVSGEGRAEVTATGQGTEFGKIAAQAKKISPPRTPLQLAMKKLTGYLVWAALFFSAIIPILGIWRGQNLQDAVLTGLALAFATVPEEGPIIVTMVLGLGAYQLSKQKFLIKKLKAAETLGDATVILTDKTGTLTENTMNVIGTFPADGKKDIIAAAMALQTKASALPDDQTIQRYAQKLGVKTSGEVLAKRDFTAGRKTKSALISCSGKFKLITIGAPEEIFALAKSGAEKYRKELDNQAAAGKRIIAVAAKDVAKDQTKKDLATLESDSKILGLIIIEDPARHGVAKTLKMAANAGIRTIMVTGDHPQTARFVASEVGIDGSQIVTSEELAKVSDSKVQEIVKTTSVFARISPQDKYRLLQALQENHEVVAVTGDGVNDTLALKGANVGIAMGIKGTDAAKEAADVVLADDNYSTIANAIFQGRKFFDNLRKGFQYYLSVKLALVLIFALPIFIGTSFPFAPIQIILLELFMDLAASWAFVAEPPEPTIYKQKPRDPRTQLINRAVMTKIVLSSLSLFAAVWGSYFYAVNASLSPEIARTFAFSAWVVSHIFLAFVSRSAKTSLFKIGLFSNKAIDIWAVAALALLLAAINIPLLADLLKLRAISLGQLGIVTLISFVAIGWLEIAKLFQKSAR